MSVSLASCRLPVTSPFGWRVHPISGEWKFHTGVDLGYEAGSVIVAVMDGRVSFAGMNGGFGHTVTLDHGERGHTLYAHCKKLLVRRGEFVRQGCPIALVGDTGNATGPHLHLEWWLNGRHVDPLLLWNRRNIDARQNRHGIE